MFLMFVGGHGDGGEHQRQPGEDQALDEPHQQLQPVDPHGGEERHQKGGHQHQNLARRHIAEQPEGEADQPHELAESLQRPDKEKVQQPLKGVQQLEPEQGAHPVSQAAHPYELAEVPQPQHPNPQILHENKGNQGQGQGHIDIGSRRTQQVNFHNPVSHKPQRRVDGQQPNPGVNDHEQEYGRDYREQQPRPPRPDHALNELQQGFDGDFAEVLQAPRHQLRPPRSDGEYGDQDDAGNPAG